MNNAYRVFEQAPVIIGFVRGQDYVIEFANDGLLAVWKVGAEVHGKSLFEVFPELEGQGFRKLLDDVRLTGIPFTAYEHPIVFERNGNSETAYFDFIYKPYVENNNIVGVISVGYDVTDKVLAKRNVERGERKWKQLADSMPVMVWTANEKGEVDFFNKLWYTVTGFTEEETLGTGWAAVLHPDDLARCLKTWEQAVAKKTFYQIEARLRTKDGSYIWVLGLGVPVVEENVIVSWYGTNTDITEHKAIENQLEDVARDSAKEVQEKTALLNNILKNSTNGISVSRLIRNEAGEVVDAQTIMANDSAVKYIGLPKELYLTKPASFFDPNIISSPYGQACVNTLRTGEPFIMRYFLDFSKRWLELTVSKMDDSHLIHHFTDVTSIREAELKLEKTLEELRYSNANLEAFAYAASHDLKEPIRKAQYFTNRLRDMVKSKLQDEELALFDRLQNAHGRMSKLIDDLLEFSQAAKGTTENESIDLNEVIANVLEDLELEIQNTEAKLNVSRLPQVRGNKRQVHQMFQNLITNALKYVKESSTPQVEVRSTALKGRDVNYPIPGELRDGDFHLIQVADNGIGFEQKHADNIFKLFTRLHANETYRGSGIGLSIVRKVVDSHRGFIWAESEPSKGAVFNILLPVH
ncbi:MAG TPA: PAS domain S-box protein [Chryseolinea sp.]